MDGCVCNIVEVPGASVVYNEDTHIFEVQRCDAHNIFGSDGEAGEAVQEWLVNRGLHEITKAWRILLEVVDDKAKRLEELAEDGDLDSAIELDRINDAIELLNGKLDNG